MKTCLQKSCIWVSIAILFTIHDCHKLRITQASSIGKCASKLLYKFMQWLSQYRICLQCGRPGFDHWVGKIPWRRAWQPTPVFSPGESPMDRGAWLAIEWGGKESDTTEWLAPNFPLWSSTLFWDSLVTQLIKNPPAMQETWVQSLGWEYPLEKGKATHSKYCSLGNSMDCIVHRVP